ncbi:MAG: SH3 domain-containing protein [Pseudomonadota bacterium]
MKIADPYIELHTGAGRGYPVFFVAGRDEWIEILLRHTDWYKVRTASGQEGWVHRSQLERTVTDAGGQKTFRDVMLDDYLRRRVEMGAAWGRFKAEPMLKLWAGYRFSDTLSGEFTLGQVQGVFSGTDFWHLNLNVEPWSDKRLSPFFGIGLGRFKNVPNDSLVGAIPTNANLGNAVIGLRYHVSDRFVLRADYSLYTAFVSEQRSLEYRAFTAGLSFFF